MNRAGPPVSLKTERILLIFATAFQIVFAVALTLAPAARLRTWVVDFRWSHWLGVLVWIGVFWLSHRYLERRLPERDPFLLPVAGLLTGWGLMTIFRLTPSFGLRQTVWLGISGIIFLLGLRLPSDLSTLRRFKYLWLTIGLGLTAATLVLGTNPQGAGPRLWLGCCGLYFQPSEPLKLLLIAYLAAYMADRAPRSGITPAPFPPPSLSLFRLAPTLMMTGLALLLLVVQRDLGTASIFLFLYAVIVYAATSDWRVPLISVIVLGLAGAIGYFLFDVVQLRVDAWLNPWLDPSGRSYQIVQSLLAIANGGLLGRGPGLGNPGLVPVPQSDFIFSAISEEFGLLGALGLLVVLGLWLERGLRAALAAPDVYRRLLAAGVTLHLAIQSILIIGGNLRLLPLTGVTLPFVSYGGSSLLVAFIELLILVRISASGIDQPTRSTELLVYRRLAGGLLIGLVAAGLAAGWWGFWRGPNLLTRTDNARRSIADRFVQRGAILDRQNQPLAESVGTPGVYLRTYPYAALGPIVGYTHPIYGQSGLEASLDAYLRGLQGNPDWNLWQNHLLYGMPPPGLDVRLSLDLQLQETADELLGSHPGAMVLLNAQSGEILAMATHPTFDANNLDQTWESLIQDSSAPLFDRAAAGLYPPGVGLGPFLLAEVTQSSNLPNLPANFSYRLNDFQYYCAFNPQQTTWGATISGGCPASTVALVDTLGSTALIGLLDRLGLFTAPIIRLPTSSGTLPLNLSDPGPFVLGQANPATNTGLAASPLQMALAAATLSNQGLRPAPRLVMAVDKPQSGWVILPTLSYPIEVFSSQIAADTASQLADPVLPIWQVIACVPSEAGNGLCWYLGGTLDSWHGAPLAIAVLLERNEAVLTTAIGRGLLESALTP
jgi:cell division protein FtsW (lipid II flippase)